MRALSDVHPSPCQTCLVVGDLQTTIRQNMGHLIAGKQSQCMTLNVVLGTFWCSNEVMHVHRGQPSINEAGIDPRNLQVRFVNKSCMNRPWSPGLWGEPRFDQQDTTSAQVRCHTLERSGEVIEGFDIPNGTEEAGHDVKRTSEIKVGHICMVQRDVRIAIASDGE